MDTHSVVFKLNNSQSTYKEDEKDLVIRLWGLANGYDFHCSASDIFIEHDGLDDFLFKTIGADNCSTIMSRDYEVVGATSEVTKAFLSGSHFDSENFILFEELMESTSYSEEAMLAGVALQIPIDKIEDAYEGEFKDLKALGLYYAELMDIPDWIVPYFDYEEYGRTMDGDYNSFNNHYFGNRY